MEPKSFAILLGDLNLPGEPVIGKEPMETVEKPSNLRTQTRTQLKMDQDSRWWLMYDRV